MANDYYSAPTEKVPLTTIRSTVRNNDAEAVEAGFEKLPSEIDLKRDQFGTDSSTVATLYIITIPNLTVPYYEGLQVTFEAKLANIGAASIQVNGGTNVDMVDVVGSALEVGAINVGQIVSAVYTSNGDFRMVQSDSASSAAAASSSAAAALESETNAAASAADALESETNAAASAAKLDDVTQHFYRNS